LAVGGGFEFFEDFLEGGSGFAEEGDVVEDGFDVGVEFLDEDEAGELGVFGEGGFGEVEEGAGGGDEVGFGAFFVDFLGEFEEEFEDRVGVLENGLDFGPVGGILGVRE
jgi:hypothetical protein